MVDAKLQTYIEGIINNNPMMVSLNISKSKRFKEYLNQFNEKESKEIIKIIEKTKDSKKRILLNEIIMTNYEKYKAKKESKRNLISQLRNIEEGFFTKNIVISKEFERTCNRTYKGFYRALNARTLQTTKVKLDGKLTRVFIKDSIGAFGIFEGTNKLFIEPNSLDVYAFKSNKDGKITSFEKRIDFKNKSHLLSGEIKEVAYVFKKELYDYIKQVYFKNKKPLSFKKKTKPRKILKPKK